MLWHAYVDESGDRGWIPRPATTPLGKQAGSSCIFSLTAILVPDGYQSIALSMWDQAAADIGKTHGALLHWHDVKGTGKRKHLTKTVASVPDIQVISVVLCKWHLPNATKIRSDPSYLYNWPMRFLIERLSWFGQQHNSEVAMTFSQVKGLPPSKLLTYLAKLGQSATFIEWNRLKMPPRIDTPANRRMLQLADTASASIFAAFEIDTFGFTDQTYLKMLQPVLWRRPNRPLQKDGLKFGPWPHTSDTPQAECHAEHPWLASFCRST